MRSESSARKEGSILELEERRGSRDHGGVEVLPQCCDRAGGSVCNTHCYRAALPEGVRLKRLKEKLGEGRGEGEIHTAQRVGLVKRVGRGGTELVGSQEAVKCCAECCPQH